MEPGDSIASVGGSFQHYLSSFLIQPVGYGILIITVCRLVSVLNLTRCYLNIPGRLHGSTSYFLGHKMTRFSECSKAFLVNSFLTPKMRWTRLSAPVSFRERAEQDLGQSFHRQRFLVAFCLLEQEYSISSTCLNPKYESIL